MKATLFIVSCIAATVALIAYVVTAQREYNERFSEGARLEYERNMRWRRSYSTNGTLFPDFACEVNDHNVAILFRARADGGCYESDWRASVARMENSR